MDAPETRYARSGDVAIAYQSYGEGPDLVFVPGWFSHLDLFWQMPHSRRFFSRLASFAHVVAYDKRGTGLSDPVDSAGSFVDRMDDLDAVLAATGLERMILCGLSEGGSLAAIYAATHPERVASLVLLNAPVSPGRVPGVDEWREEIANGWGEGALFEQFLPEAPDNDESRRLWALNQRMSASRALALQYFDQVRRLDAAPYLSSISAPTLVLRGTEDRVVTGKWAQEMADAIPDARLLEVPGGHIPWVMGGDRYADAIEEFVTGTRRARPARRRVATVLFTDIVDSTAQAAALGDRAWRELLDRHDDEVRTQLARWEGREVKATGDGFLAAFEGPVDAIDCALAIRERIDSLGVRIRAGIHTGQCEIRDGDLGGIAIHIGARVAALAGPDEVLVSQTVRDLVVGGDVSFSDRGEHELKGVPDRWKVFAVQA